MPVGNHSNIPFSRVNHSKFMVTDKAAYIGEPLREAFGQDSGLGRLTALESCRVRDVTHRGHTNLQKGDMPLAGGQARVLKGTMLFYPAWTPRDRGAADGFCTGAPVEL